MSGVALSVELDRNECIRLLSSHSLGRLCVVENEYPVAFPVNYRVVVDTMDHVIIVLRARHGSVLDRPKEKVSFQVDGIDPISQTGWSVLARGQLQDALAEEAPGWLQFWNPHPWVGDRFSWLYIETVLLTGRRLVQVADEWALEFEGYL
jgi:uncharacterized protein